MIFAMTVASALLTVLIRGRLALEGQPPPAFITDLFYPSLAVLGVAVVFSTVWLYKNWIND